MDELLNEVIEALNLKLKIYFYEFYPRTDEQSERWGKFLEKQYEIAILKTILKSRRYIKKMREIKMCMNYNIGQSEYLKLKKEWEEYIADKPDLNFGIDNSEKGIEKIMLKYIKKYEKLLAKK